MKIGVFDSGIGGEIVALALQESFPHAELLVVNDRRHVPYGDKSAAEVIKLTIAAIQPLIAAQCDVIVLACNTATAYAIEPLRMRYPTQKFIGLEPMIKPAASLTKSKTIAVCATPATLASERYASLTETYASDLKIIEPDCSQWAYMIEYDQINIDIIKKTIADLCTKGADVIVLACTHYHWIKELIESTAQDAAIVLEPSHAIANRVESLLQSTHSAD